MRFLRRSAQEYLYARGKRIYLGHAGNIHGTRWSVRGSGNRDRHGWQLLNNIYECSWCRVGGEKEEEEQFKRDFFSLSSFPSPRNDHFRENVRDAGLMEDSTKERCVSIFFFFFF